MQLALSLPQVPSSASRSVAALIAAAAALAGCPSKAKITSFRVAPPQICAGAQATLEWEVDGDATIAADPAIAGLGPVPAKERRTVSPPVTTTYTLEVRKGSSEAFARQQLDVVSSAPAGEVPLQLEAATCEAGIFTAQIDVPAAKWPSAIKVIEVRSSTAAALHVEHDGRAADLPPAAGAPTTSATFKGAGVGGLWRATTPVPDCAEPPEVVILRVTVACSI